MTDLNNLDAAEKRRLLIELLEKKRTQKLYPVSYTQEALWFINQLNPIQTAFSLFPDIRIRGPLRLDVAEKVLNEMLRRHEVLRTRFPEQNGTPIQVVDPFQPRQIPLIDLSHLSKDEQRRETRRLSLEQPAIDLREDAVVGGKLVRWSMEEHVLLLYIHHIIFDGWSFVVASREIASLYEAFEKGMPSPLPQLPMQYGDFAIWQRQLLTGNRLSQLEKYWFNKLQGIQTLELPTDRPRLSTRNIDTDTIWINVPTELNRKVTDFARREGVTLYMFLLAVFCELLHRFTEMTDIAVGSPVVNRRHPGFETLIGYFINMLVMRNDLSGDPSFMELLRRVRKSTIEGLDHQDLTFDRVVKLIEPPRDLSRHPLIQVMFVLQNTPQPVVRVGDLWLERVSGLMQPGESIFDLTMEWMLEGSQLRGQLVFNKYLFDRQFIMGLSDHYLRLMEDVLNKPNIPLSAISSHGMEAFWQDGVGTEQLLQVSKSLTTVPDLFASVVLARPQAIAMEEISQRVTYAELDAWSDQLASSLICSGIRRGNSVAVLLPPGMEVIAVLLAIMKAGAAYIPLDLGLPDQRIRTILDDSEPGMLITNQKLAQQWKSLNYDSWVPEPMDDSLMSRSTDRSAIEIQPDDLAYIIYTSGSTGIPKGVQIDHSAFMNYCVGAVNTYGLKPDDRVLQFSSLSFDAHVEEIYPILLAGGTLVLRDENMMDSLSSFSHGCSKRMVSMLSLPTGFWQEWILWLDRSRGSLPVALRQVILGGEALQSELVRVWFGLTKGTIRLINSYGPTETTVVATAVELTLDHIENYRPPIGRPLPGVKVKVVDRLGRMQPVGAIGELLIGGNGLSTGYKGRSDLTQRAFFFDHRDGLRWYRSGDRVRWRQDGLLEFIGRSDEQVKIRGFRVEPGEIEAALILHPMIERVAIKPIQTDAGVRLCAYLGVGNNQIEWHEVRDFLKRRLPDYMIPARYTILKSLPLSASGKIAYDQLPIPETAEMNPGIGSEELSPLEHRMAALWREALGIEHIRRDDNFFDLGGDSLSALRLVAKIQEIFGVQLGLGAFFKTPTLSQMVEIIETQDYCVNPIRSRCIEKSTRQTYYPLSFGQEEFYFLNKLLPGSASFNIHARVRLRGSIDKDALMMTMEELLRRHDILRTRFVEKGDSVFQQVDPDPNLDWYFQDLSTIPLPLREEAIMNIANGEAMAGFDLAIRPPLRIRLIRTNIDEYQLLLTAHHIILDAWSVDILTRETALFYEAFSQGRMIALRKPALQYGDYAIWQRREISGQLLDNLISYWKQRLVNIKPLIIPTDRPRPSGPMGQGCQFEFQLGTRLANRIGATAREEKTSKFVILLCAFNLLLHRYTGEKDILVGVPYSGRDRREISDTVGCFVNELVMRTDLSGNPYLSEALERTKITVKDAIVHHELPFNTLVQVIRPEREPRRNPLVQVLFNYIQPTADISGVNHSALDFQIENTEQPFSSEYDLVMTVHAHESEITVQLQYHQELFNDDTIIRLASYWKVVIEMLVNQRNKKIGDFSLLSESEQIAVLSLGRGPDMNLSDKMVCELIEANCELMADAPAVMHGENNLTYRELGQKIRDLSSRLVALGLRKGELVVLSLNPSLHLPVAMLAIMRAGGAIIMLDPLTPKGRIKQILINSKPRFAVADIRIAQFFVSSGVHIIDLDYQNAVVSERVKILPEDLAYCIYTSGTTGMPKGVMIEHRSLLNAVITYKKRHNLASGDRMLHQSSLSFDATIVQIFSPLCAGASVVMINQAEDRWDVEKLIQTINYHNVTVINVVPTLLAQLNNSAKLLSSVRLVICGGEVLNSTHITNLCKQARIVNEYGPTEVSVTATYHELTNISSDDSQIVPIGRPLPNYSIYLTDEYGNLVPPNISGEICVGGIGVARGYLNMPFHEAQLFLDSPFLAGEKIYKTGDLGRWRHDGTLDYLGRIDRQIKIRGIRIEPAEIEAALLSHSDVKHSAVRLDKMGRLIAFVALENGAESRWESSYDLISDIKQKSRLLLPYQIQLADIFIIKVVPLSPNGKIDYEALLKVSGYDWGECHSNDSMTSVEVELAEIWKNILCVSGLKQNDDFFSLGGHSLQAVETVGQINTHFGTSLPVTALFEHPRLSDFARLVSSKREIFSGDISRVMLLNKGHVGAPFFCIHGFGGMVTPFWGLARNLEPYPVYGVGAVGFQGDNPPEDDILAMAVSALADIKKIQTDGPYKLGGWSMGGWIATEIARKLLADGQQPPLLVLFDTPLAINDESVFDVRGLLAPFGGVMKAVAGSYTLKKILHELNKHGVNDSIDHLYAERLHTIISAHRKALDVYSPQSYPENTVYFSNRASWPREKWKKIFPNIKFEKVEGDHFSMLQEPAVSILSEKLKNLF